MLGANLRHSHLWFSYGRFLEHIFISPAQHQIHHSNDKMHYETNYGVVLSVWDWAFGSLYIASTKSQRLSFGLDEQSKNHNPRNVCSAIIEPLIAVMKSLNVFLKRKPAVKNSTRAIDETVA